MGSRKTTASGSKVKLPYEMLINKLVESLDTPDIVKDRELPIPTSMQSVSFAESLLNTNVKAKDTKQSHGVYAERYARMATGTSVTESEPKAMSTKQIPAFSAALPKQ